MSIRAGSVRPWATHWTSFVRVTGPGATPWRAAVARNTAGHPSGVGSERRASGVVFEVADTPTPASHGLALAAIGAAATARLVARRRGQCRRRRTAGTVACHAAQPPSPDTALTGRRLAASATLGRCLLTMVLAPRAALAADGGDLMRSGMEAFTKARVGDSIKLFDDAAAAGYPKALLWQRGLSLYYADRFEDGAAQFRKDVEMNPNDTEESIWTMLCEAQTLGFEEARKRMLTVGRDGRRVMRTVYTMFRGEDEAAAIAALEKSAATGGSDQFYAALYLGLFAESKGKKEEAKRWITQATASAYAKTSGDYMADLARVHQKLRGWEATSSEL